MPGYFDANSGATWGYEEGENEWGGALNRFFRRVAYVGIPVGFLGTRKDPPATPNIGDRYILLASPTGAWLTFSQNDIAVWGRDEATPATIGWQRFSPYVGQHMYNRATEEAWYFTGSAWKKVGLADA